MIHHQGRSRLILNEQRNGAAITLDLDGAGLTMIVSDEDALIEAGLLLFRLGRKMKRLAAGRLG
jgi:hypothetical protein